MKKVLLIAISFACLVSCTSTQNSNKQAQTGVETRAEQTSEESIENDAIVILYFHGKQRCVTCNRIEELTKWVVDNHFSELIKTGKMQYKVVDISTKEGEKIADRYEVTWSSLFINRWKDGSEIRNNMTDFGFSHAKSSPDTFKSGIKKRIDELVSTLPNN